MIGRQLEIVLQAFKTQAATNSNSEVAELLDEMRRGYLTQFVYFASQAYVENADHPMAAYKQALACLMKAHDLEASGRPSDASALVASAIEAIYAVPEPTGSTHFMDLQYHEKNYAEFLTFGRMSARHVEVRERLKHLAFRATRLKQDGRGRQPQLSFAFAPILGWGTRSASALGVVLSIAPLLGWDTATIHASVNALWAHAIDQVPQLAQAASDSGLDLLREAALAMDPSLATTNTGGLAANTGGLAAHTGGLAAHTGGLAAKFAAAASHTGGFA